MSKFEAIIGDLEHVLAKPSGLRDGLKQLQEESEAVENARATLRQPPAHKKGWRAGIGRAITRPSIAICPCNFGQRAKAGSGHQTGPCAGTCRWAGRECAGGSACGMLRTVASRVRAGRNEALLARAADGPAIEDRLATLDSAGGSRSRSGRRNVRRLVDRTRAGLRHRHAARRGGRLHAFLGAARGNSS